MTHAQIWPDLLYIVRHGESAGNVAREAALAAGNLTIDLTVRDVDVPLSILREDQSVALGKWFAALPSDKKPNVILTSPYLRARHSAQIIAKSAGLRSDRFTLLVDERLREKEFGILDRLTKPASKRITPIRRSFVSCSESFTIGRQVARAGVT